MMETLKKLFRGRFKRTNFKAFTFFLIFSLLIWILVQFSKNYEEVVRVPIVYAAIPKDKIISEEPLQLEVRLRETGFEILWFSLFSNKLQIDLTQLKEREGNLVFDVSENEEDIRQKLDLLEEDVVFLNESIRIAYRQKAVKKVSVVSRIKVVFQPGYASKDSVRLSPDSLKISGPEELVASVKKLETILLELKKVDGDISGRVPIDTSGIGQLSIYSSSVEYSMKVEKFTEGKIKVPLEVINLPDSLKINLFPESVHAIFQVSLENYNDIEQDDFRIVCDYAGLEGDQGFFIPIVLERPKKITNLRLSTNKVEFILKK